MTDRIRRQFHVAAALRNRCSHSSLSSVESTNSSSQQLATETATATTDHNVNVSSTCLSCTRRNVTGGAFPRLRKVSNRLLTTFTRTIDSTRDNLSASLAKGRGDYSTCSVESCANNTAMASGNINCHDDDGTTTLLSSARDPRCFSQVYPTCHPARASLCLGKHPERLPTDCIPEALARGCALLKTTARGAHIREFRLDIAQQRITWDSRKKKKLAHIDLERIVEVRVGGEALWAVSNEDCLSHGYSRLFAIVYYHQMSLKTVCVEAPTDASFYEWIETLNYLLSNRQSIDCLAHFRRWQLICINRQWWEITSSSSDQGKKSATESLAFIEELMNNGNSESMAAVGDLISDLIDGTRHEQHQECIEVLYNDIVRAYSSYAPPPPPLPPINDGDDGDNGNDSDNDNDDDDDEDQLTIARQQSSPPLHLDLQATKQVGMLTLPVFARFLREEQKEAALSDAEIQRIFKAFTLDAGQGVMRPYDLEAYLMSIGNNIYQAPEEEDDGFPGINLDMPLNEYYIASSHNTYLASDQLVGSSTVEGYIHALLRGCRCLELDCWDGRGGEPVVCHGHTLTTRILFEDAILAISRYAFAVSAYPVILSFETHCSIAQQRRMASILVQYLGSVLVAAPVDGSDQMLILPSPSRLKHRIIVKNKVLDTHLQDPSGNGSAASLAAASGSHSKRKIAPELSRLIVYCKAVHFEGFEDDEDQLSGNDGSSSSSSSSSSDDETQATTPVYDQVVSVSESTSNQLIRQQPQKYRDFNRVQMTRVYPSFSRVRSTNYNPLAHWMVGCQLVAMNYQTPDKNMQIYNAMFAKAHGLGYVLKPEHLRGNSEEGPVSNGSCPTTIHLTLVSALNVGRGKSTLGPSSRRVSAILDRKGSFVVDTSTLSRPTSKSNSNHPQQTIAEDTTAEAQVSSPTATCLSQSPPAVDMYSPVSPPGEGDEEYFQSATTIKREKLMRRSSSHHIRASLNQQLAAAAGDPSALLPLRGKGNSRLRVEIEWISGDPSKSGGSDSSSSSSGSSSSSSNGSGMVGVGPAEEEPTPATGYFQPHHQRRGSIEQASLMVATPGAVPIMPPPCTPFNHPAAAAAAVPPPLAPAASIATPGGTLNSQSAGRNVGSGRYLSSNGYLNSRGEVRWLKESPFRIINDPETAFVRLAVLDDDVELGSACVSIDGLKEGYRFIELRGTGGMGASSNAVVGAGGDRCKINYRSIYLLIRVQISQLHCLVRNK